MTEETAPQTDAEVVRETMIPEAAPEPVEPVRRGPGRPKGSSRKLSAAQRSEQARKAGLARAEQQRAAKQAVAAGVSEERKLFWGQRVQSLWNKLAGLRGYETIPNDPQVISEIGEPTAKMMDQLVPMADDRPWLQLLVIMTPLIGGAAVVEYQRWREAQLEPAGAGRDFTRPSPDGPPARIERGGIRPQGQRQVEPPEEYLGTPIGG